MRTTITLLTACLVAGCTSPGDFCDVWQGEKIFVPETAATIVETDRPDAVGIAIENEYGRLNCR